MLRFFRWYCHPELVDFIEGDLIEVYRQRLATMSTRRANLKFLKDVILLFRPRILKPFRLLPATNPTPMFKNYFVIGWRNLLKQKGYSLINIGGLAIGLAVALWVGLWAYNEFSYDHQFPNRGRIARVMQNQTFNGQVETWGSQAMQLGPALRAEYANYFEHVIVSSFPGDQKLTVGDKSVKQRGCYMEPGAASMLSLSLVAGHDMKDMHSVLLSQSAAYALFGVDDAVGKSVTVNNKLDVTVAGVYKDLPRNSSFAYLQLILPWQLLVASEGLEQRVQWGNSWFQCFVQTASGTNMQQVSALIKDVKARALAGNPNEIMYHPELFLHPMARWHLYGNFKNGVNAGGAITQVWTIVGIGGAVLLLACINFINLSTARSERRAKEVGIRKVVGSLRKQLMSQFFIESMLVAALALVLALMLVQVALPFVNTLSGSDLRLMWASPVFWFTCLGIVGLTGLLAGSYPALLLSSFKPVRALKGIGRSGRGSSLPRKTLVTFQFTVSIALIIGTIVIYNQVDHARHRPVGYRSENVLMVAIQTPEVVDHLEAVRQDLLSTGMVLDVAASESPVTSTYTTNSGYYWQGKDPDMADEFVTVGVSPSFGKTIGWQMLEGKDFEAGVASDSTGFIINETAARYMGFENPVGEKVRWNDNGEWTITGVVKDMVTRSAYTSVRPMIFYMRSNRLLWIKFNVLSMRLSPSVSAADALAGISKVMKKYDPQNSLDYTFVDEEFGKKFQAEEKTGGIALVMTCVAVLISCLGLLGLSSFMAEQRTKELGIRKVMGASVAQLWQLLSKDFVLLVLLSCGLAIPLAFYFMSDWLLQYDYRVALRWPVFVVSATVALVIALATVSIQTIKAALANPVKSLRSE